MSKSDFNAQLRRRSIHRHRLHQKLATFARLHPSVTAAVATSVALMIGPRRLVRVGRSVLPALLPLLSKMRSSK